MDDPSSIDVLMVDASILTRVMQTIGFPHHLRIRKRIPKIYQPS
jgi:hypothetical protein